MSRLKYKIAFGAIAMALAACASAPSYRAAANAEAQGYSEQVIAADRYRVSYTGDAGMSKARVQDFALLRAAELTAEKGRDWFEVVNRDTDAETKTRRDIDTEFGPDYAVSRSCGLLGCTTEARPVVVRTETETLTTRTIYQSSLEIVMGTGEPLAGSPGVYDAADTLATLKARIG